MQEKEIRETFQPIDVVYKPVSKVYEIANGYFAKSIRQAYRGVCSKDKKGTESTTAEQCYGCNKFFTKKKTLENHIKICGSMPGIV